MRRILLFLALGVLSAGCNQSLSLSGSCNGDSTASCPPYAYAEVASATLEPAALRPGQLAATARVHVVLRTCGAMGPQHGVHILAHTDGDTLPDGGSNSGDLLIAEVADDGTNGDMVAGDGMIDATIGNPFTTAVAGNTSLQLGFVAFAFPFCSGSRLDVPYTTGPTYVVPPPM